MDHTIITGDTHEYTDLAAAADLLFNNADQFNHVVFREARRIIDLPD